MKRFFILAAAVAMFSSCDTQDSSGNVTLKDFSDSASYAVGTSIGLNLVADFKAQGVDSAFKTDMVLAGLTHTLLEDSAKLSKEEAQALVGKFFEQMNTQRATKNQKSGEAFLKENGSKPGVVTTASGLQYIVLQEGAGPNPTLVDQVVVHYTGKLLNGDVFDSSVERNEPVTFYVRSVIPGWTEALQLMKPGAAYKLFIPGNLAYGDQGNPRGGIGPNEVLIFDVKLIEIAAPTANPTLQK